MSRLLMRTESDVEVAGYDRAIRLSKKLTRILRDELGEQDFRLHMAQKAVAAGLRCPHPHAMIGTQYPRAWNGGRVIDLLVGRGFVSGRDIATEAVDALEERNTFAADAVSRMIGASPMS